MEDHHIHPASFRDPSGFVFEKAGKIYRQVNRSAQQGYDLLINSGLYANLVSSKLLIAHEEVHDVVAEQSKHYKTLLPLQLRFVSYPYEWSFAQLKDAALLTLTIARDSMEHGLTLKDATPFNVQFDPEPIFIDTLSFESYLPNEPWTAYRQFCTMFLFPLLIEHYTGNPVHRILTAYPEGVPVNIAAAWLPFSSRFNMSVWLHVHLQNKVSKKNDANTAVSFTKAKMVNLLRHLVEIVERLRPSNRSTWVNYYESDDLTKDYLGRKGETVLQLLSNIPPGTVFDAGANRGYFSELLANRGFTVIATDADAATVGCLYQKVREQKIDGIYPLVNDIANPAPASGFRLAERKSFYDRMQFDLVLALALIHHLAIDRNIPLSLIARYFADIAPLLMIEWVPREDRNVVRMLSTRKDIFTDYNIETFELEFSRFYHIVQKEKSGDAGRYIYLMKRSQI